MPTDEDDFYAYLSSPFYDSDEEKANSELDICTTYLLGEWEDYFEPDEAEYRGCDNGQEFYDHCDSEEWNAGIEADKEYARQRLEGTVVENIPIEFSGLEEKLVAEPAPPPESAPAKEERIKFVSPSGQKEGYLFSQDP